MKQVILDEMYAINDILADKKIMLVKDQAFDFLDIAPFFNKYNCVEFSGFTSNPLYEQVCEGVELYNRNACEIIVAVGGGSTIDVAKCIKLYCKMSPNMNYLDQKKVDTKIPLIAIPTTAGTGSESTRHAVIYFEGVKQSITHTSIVPNYVVLDVALLKTLPIYQKKCTMLDALGQAIESWWSVNSNEESKEYSRLAIKKIKKNWEEYIFNNDTEIAAREILLAANYAGRAINITATTAAHAMSYKITSLYGLPHGHAVAVCLKEVWGYMNLYSEECIDVRGSDYFYSVMKDISSMMDYSYYVTMLEKMEIKGPTSQNKKADIDILVEAVNPERLKNNPVMLSKETLYGMYGRIVQNES